MDWKIIDNFQTFPEQSPLEKSKGSDPNIFIFQVCPALSSIEYDFLFGNPPNNMSLFLNITEQPELTWKSPDKFIGERTSVESLSQLNMI